MSTSFFSNPIELQGNACFISDVHFGVPSDDDSMRRETMLIQLLDEQKKHVQYLFLLGDIFDFWFEYKDVVPKGYYRFFSKLYELHQSGVKIYYFTGNHDMWVQHYFAEQFQCEIFFRQQAFLLNGKRCLIGHGDGLGGKQYGYKLIKSIFGFRPNRFIYSMFHPRQAFSLARFCSGKSRAAHPKDVNIFKNEEEPQIQYARKLLQNETVDFFIYAHRHLPMKYQLTDTSIYFNTGDWLTNFSYLMFNQNDTMPILGYYKEK